MEEGKWIISVYFGILIGISVIFFAIMPRKNKKKSRYKLSDKEINTMDDETFINYVEDYLRVPDYTSTPLRKNTSRKVAEVAFIISCMITAFFRR